MGRRGVSEEEGVAPPLASPRATNSARTDGTIKRLTAKGFGFIQATDGEEYFFHHSAVADFDALREGQKVTFEKTDGPKGPRAELVELV